MRLGSDYNLALSLSMVWVYYGSYNYINFSSLLGNYNLVLVIEFCVCWVLWDLNLDVILHTYGVRDCVSFQFVEERGAEKSGYWIACRFPVLVLYFFWFWGVGVVLGGLSGFFRFEFVG